MDGSASAQATGGVGGYQYNWSNGQMGPAAVNLGAGTYSVTVTDGGNNTATADVNIQQPNSPTTIATLIHEDVSCNGKSDGQIQVMATGNNGGFTYLWSNGRSGTLVDKLMAGTYRVTATDIKNCMSIESFEIEEPDAFESVLESDNLSCNEDSSGYAKITPQNGRQPFLFNWSDGVMENGSFTERNDLGEGQYTVVITDFDNCSEVETITIEKDEIFNIEVVQVLDNLCSGGSDGSIEVEVIDVVLPFVLQWNTGDTSNLIQDLSSGTYTVTVEDGNGCVDSIAIEIEEPPMLELEIINLTQPQCSTDSAEVVYTYNGGFWNGQPFDTITRSLGLGQQFITVSDSNGCVIMDTLLISISDTIGPELILNASDIYLDESGHANVTFAYFDNGSNDECGIDSIVINPSQFSCDDLGSQTIHITAWDGSGLMSQDSLAINVVDTLAPVVICFGDTILVDCDFSYQLPIATDNCDSVTYTVVSGPSPGAVFPVGKTQVILEIEDESGNQTTCSFDVEIINDLEISSQTITEGNCAGDTSSFILYVTGGKGQKTWINNGDTLQAVGDSLRFSTVGVTSVEVWDTTGCFASISVGRSVLPLKVDSATVQQLSGPGKDDGSIELAISGGAGNYSFEWYNSNDMLIGSDNPVTGLSPDKYYCIVSDSNGCQILSDTFEIRVLTSTIDSKASMVQIFPNPTLDVVNISSVGLDIHYVTVQDIMGNTHVSNRFNGQPISVKSLSPGVYFTIIETNRGIVIKQLMIIK
jgi:hypothetical protein